MEGFAFTRENILAGAKMSLASQILPGLMRGSYGFLLSAPGKGKTFFLISLSYELALAKPYVGLIAADSKPCRVMFVAAEDFAHGVFSRSADHIAHFSDHDFDLLEQNLKIFNLPHALISRFLDPKCERALDKLIEIGKNYDFIILDTIRKCTGTAREVEEDTVYEAMLERIATETNAAVMVSHHLRKNQGSGRGMEPVDSTGGSGLSSTQARSKYHIFFDFHPKDEKIKYITHTKDNYIPRDYVISTPRVISFDNGLMIDRNHTNVNPTPSQPKNRQPKEKTLISTKQKTLISTKQKQLINNAVNMADLPVQKNPISNGGTGIFGGSGDDDF